MYHFEYVSKKEAAPYKSQLIELLNRVQDYVRDEFTFQFTFIGSSSRNMITYDPTTNVGFDFDKVDWYKIAREFHDYYKAHLEETKLYEGVIDVLEYTKNKGCKNIILSASRIDLLKNHLELLGVTKYFDEILGIDDIYATSKLHLAKAFISDKNKEDCIYIGDSEHDYETAKEMDVECVLVASGHVNKERLLKCGCKVIDKIEDFKLCV